MLMGPVCAMETMRALDLQTLLATGIALPASTSASASIALPATQQLRGADYPLPTTSPQLRGVQRTCVLAETTGWGESHIRAFRMRQSND